MGGTICAICESVLHEEKRTVQGASPVFRDECSRRKKKPSVKMPSYTLHEGANVRIVCPDKANRNMSAMPDVTARAGSFIEYDLTNSDDDDLVSQFPRYALVPRRGSGEPWPSTFS